MISLVTGYAGKAHVTAAEDGSKNASIFGEGTYILDRGQKLAATATSANTITIADGDIMMQGRHICIAAGTSEEVPISNGISGMYRHDLIVLRYNKNTSSGIETVELAVIQGTSTSGTAGDPTYTAGDILNGATVCEVPLYRVVLNGINIEAVEPLFAVATNLDAARSHVANTSNPHKVTKSQVGLGNVPNVTTNNQTPTYTEVSATATLTSGETLTTAFGKIAKAVSSLISHIANKSNPHGVTKSQVGLGNVDNKSSATIRGELTKANVTDALGYTPLKTATLNVSTTDFTAVEVGKNTSAELGNVTLAAGTYLIQGSAVFAQAGQFVQGNVRLSIAQSTKTTGFTNGITKVGYVGVNGSYVEQVHSILYLSKETKIYLNAYQNYDSSGTVSVTGQLKVLKVKTT